MASFGLIENAPSGLREDNPFEVVLLRNSAGDQVGLVIYEFMAQLEERTRERLFPGSYTVKEPHYRTL